MVACRNRQVVAEAGDYFAGDILDEFRRVQGYRRRHDDGAAGRLRYGDFVYVIERLVDRGEVHGDNLLSGLAVALLDGPLDLGYRLLQRDDAGDLEEGGLHDDVDARAQTELLAKPDGVDDVKL